MADLVQVVRGERSGIREDEVPKEILFFDQFIPSNCWGLK